MDYNSLLHAIPKEWKVNLKLYKNEANTHLEQQSTEETQIIRLDDQCYDLNKISTKLIYSHIIKGIFKPPTANEKWIAEFPFINDNDLEYYYKMPHYTVKETKLQVFQYKILNRIVPCQSLLYTWKLAPDNKCENCNIYDSITHYFYDCPMATLFWTQITKWLSNNCSIQIYLAKTDVIFGIKSQKQNQFIYCVNYIIIQGKWYIYQCKMNKKNVFLLDFLVHLKNELSIEKYIYVCNGQLEIFAKHWDTLYNALG